MILKENLQLLINKYYLSGLVESVKWVINNNEVNIRFISPSSDIVGIIKGKNFNIKNGEIGIYNTTKLNKLLSILNKELFVDIIKQGNVFTKLNIEDNQFNLIYVLADLELINKNKQPEVKEPPYEIIINLSSDDILSLIKAKNALIDTTKVILKLEEDIKGDKQVEFTFGEKNNFSDKIIYVCKNISSDIVNNSSLVYNADNLKEILNSNKEIKSATVYVSLQGLMKIEFSNEFFDATYFIIQEQNDNN